ncbi:guanine nucleotide-binding protein subunit gamma 1-like, partial [Carica papaya]|uniref:guanine nucleotide-binding protein subunit gamma 1-like n=1 Tax=Carica papaya TaxID=3649 RepID=UPI000B8C8A55
EVRAGNKFNTTIPLNASYIFSLLLFQSKEELAEIDQTDNVSTLCEELLQNIETRPDPLLPLTNGPVNTSWDRWFEGPQESKGCRCRIL